MFGRLLRVTATVLVIAAAFVTPVLVTSAPAGADTVVDGCTIVSNPTATNFTNCPGANLVGADLSGIDLSFANLAGATMVDCSGAGTIRNYTCPATNLTDANLTDAILSQVTFVVSCLVDAGTQGSCGGSVALSGANMSGTDFSGAHLPGENLTGATLTNANLTGADLATVTLTNANVAGANLTNATFTDCSSFAVCADGGTLTGANFSGANFSDANLTGSTSVFELTDFTGATLTNAIFTGATLTGVIFTSATLTGANFTGTLLVPSDQQATGASSGAVVSWTVPQSLPGATPGTCTPPSGSTFGIGATTVTCQVLDASGNVATGTFTVRVSQLPPPTTSVLLPSDGATVTGDTWLDAAASSPAGIASVSFEVSGNNISDQVVGSGTPTFYGYIGGWNATTFTNGTYTIQSVATDVDGVSNTSAPITVTVDIPSPSTTVLIPSAGATQSGTTALLDALSAGNVPAVGFQVTGPGLSRFVATGTLTLYGWLAEWNTTSVPNGTYTVQSFDISNVNIVSAPVTITVSN
jgi:uncharacterized protein YjbI with pentapeptide repeats